MTQHIRFSIIMRQTVIHAIVVVVVVVVVVHLTFSKRTFPNNYIVNGCMKDLKLDRYEEHYY